MKSNYLQFLSTCESTWWAKNSIMFVCYNLASVQHNVKIVLTKMFRRATRLKMHCIHFHICWMFLI